MKIKRFSSLIHNSQFIIHNWTELNDGIRELTSKITLDDILNAYRKQNAENGICDYCI